MLLSEGPAHMTYLPDVGLPHDVIDEDQPEGPDDGGSDRYSTTSNLNVEIYYGSDAGGYELIENREYIGFCGSGTETISLSSCEDVNTLYLQISGDSAMLVDNVKLYKDNELNMMWGAENGDAWCLSTVPDDNQEYWGSFLVGGQCYDWLRFDYDEIVDYE